MTQEDSERPAAATHHVLHLKAEGLSSYSGWYGTRFEFDVLEATLDCPGFPHCTGLEECMDCRGVPDYDDASWGDTAGDEERELHGVHHEWNWGYGWVVEYEGCIVRTRELPLYDWAVEYGPGDYLLDVIDVPWDEYDAEIELLSMADGSPLPEPGYARRLLDTVS